MSSVNPVFLFSGALESAEKREALATHLAASVVLGVGQFCTNPGLIGVPAGETGDEFLQLLTAKMRVASSATMLTAGILDAYGSGTQKLAAQSGVTTHLSAAIQSNQAAPALFETDVAHVLERPQLMDEVFGPTTLAIRFQSEAQLLDLARALEGQLTATLHATAQELEHLAPLVEILETRAGRLLFGGFPTGVEVGHAIVHGGPFPATSDGRTTSVGSSALTRWTRALCWQNFPDSALPDELQDANPLGIARRVDGVFQTV